MAASAKGKRGAGRRRGASPAGWAGASAAIDAIHVEGDRAWTKNSECDACRIARGGGGSGMRVSGGKGRIAAFVATDACDDGAGDRPGRFDGGEEGHRGQILGSDVGQLYEDFFRVAAEFEQNYVADGASAGALGQGPQDAGCGQGDRQRQNPAPEGTDGLMGRLFGRRAKKDPEEFSSSNPKGAATAPQYKDYSQDFQEV
ncbi:unnamed protein product [Ostreobium quekettii]|uniref:Uncharacterized protein n=1 Tax=Ostreobium quekettii TaxID=121088 RepID=A0A8S1JFL6_9CHLO|nr:unnamed protein product [Ostreobium quekettii]